MKQYYHKEETPLAFHRCFWYILLPLQFVYAIRGMLSETSEMIIFNGWYAIDIAYYIIGLALILICFIGFFGWKSYAWYGVMTYLYIGIAYNIYDVIVYANYAPDQIGTAVGQLLAVLIYAILIGIYYKKRRPLFFADNPESVDSGKGNSQYSEVLQQVEYCRKCGYKLFNGSDFCSKCGAPVTKISP